MATTTYKNYLEYIKNEFSKINADNLSEEEKAYYEVVKRDLENSNNLPARILNSPVVSHKNQNAETLQNLETINRKIGFQGKISRFSDAFSSIFLIEKKYAIALNFAIILISIISSFFLSKTYPVIINIDVPSVSWKEKIINQTPTPEPGVPLTGSAGTSEEVKIEEQVITISWKIIKIEMTYLTWAFLPILTFMLIIYIPVIRQAWAR